MDGEPQPSRPSSARVPPHDLQAEESLLGAMLLSKDAIAAAAETLGGPDDFYKPAHAHIYEAITGLYSAGEPIDPVTVADELRRSGLLDLVGGSAALVSLQSGTPATTSAARYAKIVEEHALLRRMIWVSSEIIEGAYGVPDDVDKLIDDAESRMYAVADRRLTDTTKPIGELLGLTLDRLEELYNRGESITGVPTGYLDLDKILSGLQPNALVVVGARPAMGKCLRHDSLLVDPATGARHTIEALHQAGSAGHDVSTMSIDAKGWLVETKPSHFVDDGVKPVFRVRTRLGREVSTTITHPFLTLAGWLPLRDIGVGERIAVPRTMPVFGKEEMSELEVERLVASIDPASADASVPDIVFQLARPQLARFVASVFELHGSLTTTDHGGGYRRVSLASASKQLARDTQHLLLRFGITARLRIARHGAELEVLAADDIARFDHEIGGHQLAHAPRRRPAVPATADVEWDEIVDITYEGEHQVYDLTIPEHHNFIADDVCVHNTAFALGIASHAGLQAQKPVLLFSLEMSQLEMTQRILCAEARVDATKVRNGTLSTGEWEKIHHAVGRLANAPIFIDDNPNVTIMDIRAKSRRLKSRIGELGVVIIDYIQLMNGRSSAENRQVEVSEISRNLKILAREIETPVVALAQLNRSLEARADKRPMLSDLRESGSLEQDSDVVLFLYRDEVYNPETPDRGTAEVIVAKHRSGPTGRVRLAWLDHYTKFDNMARGV